MHDIVEAEEHNHQVAEDKVASKLISKKMIQNRSTAMLKNGLKQRPL